MEIIKERRCFACNSSSTHSIILLKDGLKPKTTRDALAGEFGWNFFTAADRKTKARYLTMTLASALSVDFPGRWTRDEATKEEKAAAEENRKLADKIIENLVREAMGDDYPGDATDSADGYVDHQSRLVIPRDFAGNTFHRGFFRDLKEFFLRDDVAILGGNDNDSKSHNLLHHHQTAEAENRIPRDTHDAEWRVRKEAWGWSLFNSSDGTKLHLTFGVTANKPNMDVNCGSLKSATPELVDVKITDFCPFGCVYCYQGSTPEGKHASMLDIHRIADICAKWNTWEVALGGGEPTLHPRFSEILALFRGKHVVPNFTTRSTHWLENRAMMTAVEKYAGAVAFSVDTANDVERFVRAIHDAAFTRPVAFQYVLGTGDHEALFEVAKAVKAAGDRESESGIPDPTLTLLGYKSTGRGEAFKPSDYKFWHGVVKDAGLHRIGIDTALASQEEKRLKSLSVDPRSYFTEEGKHSCYIDAVTGMLGPCSYMPEKMHSVRGQYGFVENDLNVAWASFGAEGQWRAS